jgi:hypothetical protein
MKAISLKFLSFLALGLGTNLAANAQDWIEVDTFPDGEPSGTWASNGLPTADTSAGYLDLRPTENSNVTSTFYVTLPQSVSSGKLTIAFDFYLPAGPEQNMAGFGVGSLAQAAGSGWGATGNRNRFQSVGSESPQNMAKVPEWTSDIFGTTEQGVWYNVWLVYDLDANPNTVTAVTKKAADPMEEGSLTTNTFAFNDTNNDDWSSIDVFATGIGLQDAAPAGTESWDALGSLFDNIYMAVGENLTEKPTSVESAWVLVDTFADGAPEAEWTVEDGITASFENNRLLVTGTTANAGLFTKLPLPSDMRQSFTVAFDMMLPAGSSGLNHVQFAVVGEEQAALTGADLFGGSDRFITFGVNAPQALANFGQWPPSLGPDLLGGTVADQWYHVWLVYDGSSKTVDFYAVAFADTIDAVEVPAEPAGSFTLETEYTDLSYLVVGVSQPGGAGVALDNIYQSTGRALSLSPTAGEIGGGGDEGVLTPGEWTQIDFGWVYGLTTDWGISTYMGYVYVADFPYVYQVDLGWMYLTSSSGNDHYFYTWDHGWILINEGFGGYYYQYSTDDYTQQIPQP